LNNKDQEMLYGLMDDNKREGIGSNEENEKVQEQESKIGLLLTVEGVSNLSMKVLRNRNSKEGKIRRGFIRTILVASLILFPLLT